MKRRDLIKRLEDVGFRFKEHGEITIPIKGAVTQNRFHDILK